MSSDRAPLSGRVALIGGGSRGIGREVALRLARSGADIAVTARGLEGAETVAAQVRQLGRRAVALETNLTSFESISSTANMVKDALGDPDILVVSGAAGVPTQALAFADTPPSAFHDYFLSQLYTRLNAVSAVLPAMRARGYGKVVVVTTDAGRVPTPGESLYGGAAAALMFMVRAIAKEVARDGVRLNAVSVTVTRHSATWEDYQAGDGPGPVLAQAFSRIEQRAAFGLNEAADVAAAIEFFASPSSDRISGASLSMNGGASFP